MNQESINCPACNQALPLDQINQHLDSNCGQSDTSSSQQQRHEPVANTKKRKRPASERVPLAERVRPKQISDFVGQDELIGDSGLLRGLIESDRCPSFILWGPPGSGKTTLARIIASQTKSAFRELSGTTHGITDCKKVFDEAQNLLRLSGHRTILFIDEIHRFTKELQQRTHLLEYLAGSRCRVFVLQKLERRHVRTILSRACAVADEETDGETKSAGVSSEVLDYLSDQCDGDARVALNLLDMILNLPPETRTKLDIDGLRRMIQRTSFAYDRQGDAHYDTISAFHKSVRGSDADATLYYLGRMLVGGEDPLYIARRMVRIASEDVGLADNQALVMAVNTYTAVQQVGMPEADCALAQLAVYLAQTKKSTRVYKAYGRVKQYLREHEEAAKAEIPLTIRNAPTRLMRSLGYGKGYKYNPDYVNGQVKQRYLPESLGDVQFLYGDEEGTAVDSELEE